jgi:hypothetical protein
MYLLGEGPHQNKKAVSAGRMNTTLTGNIFLGFGRSIHCPRCNNNNLEEIVGWTNEWGVCGFPIEILSDAGSCGFAELKARCPICYNPSPGIPDPEIPQKDKSFAENWKAEALHINKIIEEFLEIGKNSSKEYYQSLNWVHKKLYLKRLRRFGLSNLVNFIVS